MFLLIKWDAFCKGAVDQLGGGQWNHTVCSTASLLSLLGHKVQSSIRI